MVTNSALSVTQLNTYIKMLFDSDSRLKRICVVGEISNFTNHYKTGHLYFSIKDEKSSVKVVMFSGSAQYLKFRPENGMRVYLTGRVSVFERDGVYQIYAETMEPEGSGALMLAFEQLKKKLSSEGLFDAELKKALPEYPKKIGVITSPVGAALQDIINVLSRRYPLVEMVFVPVAVQGINCAAENINAITELNKRKNVDVIIIGRGGGSVEDLWGYNDEQLVRSIAASEIPVITGIGHETDFTLCDFVSDMRAPTPSAAAEIAVPDIEELYQINDILIYRFERAVENIFSSDLDYINNLILRLNFFNPETIIENRLTANLVLQERLNSALNSKFFNCDKNLNVLSEKLKLLNPLLIMKNGYIPVYYEDKRVVSADVLKIGDKIKLDFIENKILCEVTDIMK